MKVVRSKATVISWLEEDFYGNLRLELEGIELDPIFTNGLRATPGVRVDPDQMTLVIGACWDSPVQVEAGVKRENIEKDWFAVFTVSGGLAVFTLRRDIIGAERTQDFMISGTYEAAIAMCFDEHNREYGMAAISSLILSENLQ